MKIFVKRIYEKPSKLGGIRILADGLWPRGIAKSKANIGLWMKNLAPSGELRKWFHKDKEKNYKEFIAEYKKELISNRAAIRSELSKHKKAITLMTAVRDIEKSHIPTLVSFLEKNT